MTETCAECDGDGRADGTGVDGAPCEWCDGTGEVADEMLPPPAPPETFTVHVIRDGDIYEHPNVVTFEPTDTHYRFITREGIRGIIPYGPNLYAIEVVPDG